MKAEEAQQLVDLINTLVDDAVIEEAQIVEEPKEVGLSEEETNKLFRRSVPEGFSWENARPARAAITGDRVFLIFGEERRWIPDLETLQKMGWDLGDVENIPDDEIRKLKEGFGLFSCKLW
jgi:hypothetical protein